MELVCVAHKRDSRYLEHYGILGQRWGIRRTPQQLGHEPEGGKDYQVMKGKDPNADDKRERGTLGKVWNKLKTAKANHDKKVRKVAAAKKRKETMAKKKAEAEEKKKADEALAKKKAEIAKDPKKMLKNRDMFSNEEIDQALNRYALEADLSDAAAANRGRSAVDRTIDAMNKASQGIRSAATLYDNFASIYNAAYASRTGAALLPRLGNENKEWEHRRQERRDARDEAREDFLRARNDREHDEEQRRQQAARDREAAERRSAEERAVRERREQLERERQERVRRAQQRAAEANARRAASGGS